MEKISDEISSLVFIPPFYFIVREIEPSCNDQVVKKSISDRMDVGDVENDCV